MLQIISPYRKYLPYLLLFLIYALLDYRFYSKRLTTGDEPHYLIITHSLVYDHDLDVSNNYINEDWKRFLRDPTITPHYAGFSLDPAVKYSIHNFGLPLILTVPYLITGFYGALLFMNLLLILNLMFLVKLTEHFTGRPLQQWAVFWLMAFTAPLFTFIQQIYPETLASLMVLWGIYSLLVIPENRKNYYAYLAGLSVLALTHNKYLAIIGMMLFLFFLQKNSIRQRLFIIVWYLLIYLMVCSVNDWLYGHFSVSAAYGSLYQASRPAQRLWLVIQQYLFDPTWGIFFQAPIYLLFPFGLWKISQSDLQRKGWSILVLCLPLVSYFSVFIYLTTKSNCWIGFSTTGRILMPVIPVLSLLVMIGLQSEFNTWGKVVIRILGTIGVLFSVMTYRFFNARYDIPGGFLEFIKRNLYHDYDSSQLPAWMNYLEIHRSAYSIPEEWRIYLSIGTIGLMVGLNYLLWRTVRKPGRKPL